MTADLVFEGWSDPLVLHICRNMRASDVAEIFAMRPGIDAWALYRDLALSQPAHLWFEIARPADQLEPVALFGVMGTSPGVGIAHLIGTPALTLAHARQIAARVREVLAPAMVEAGMHRIEALSLQGYTWAHRFLRTAGARAEGPPRRALGKAGEDFQCFVWLKDELPAHLITPTPERRSPMCIAPKAPKIPAVQRLAAPTSDAAQREGELERQLRRSRSGVAADILTAPWACRECCVMSLEAWGTNTPTKASSILLSRPDGSIPTICRRR
ncbi:hypothetical protein MASR1M32_10490 [Rhodobacter sp.]